MFYIYLRGLNYPNAFSNFRKRSCRGQARKRYKRENYYATYRRQLLRKKIVQRRLRPAWVSAKSGPEVVKKFMLNSAEHEILNVYTYRNIKSSLFSGSYKPRMLFSCL